jgi:hypothetical protein
MTSHNRRRVLKAGLAVTLESEKSELKERASLSDPPFGEFRLPAGLSQGCLRVKLSSDINEAVSRLLRHAAGYFVCGR